MKAKILLLASFFLGTTAFTQQQNFEGVVTYNTNISSKIEEVSSASWNRYILAGDSVMVYFKNGFYKQVTPLLEAYYSPEKQKVYYKYKGVDSLFYFEYAYDSSKVLSIDKFSTVSYIDKIPCSKLEIATDNYTVTYEYAPSLYLNPAYDANNTGDRYDEYIKIAKAVYLKIAKETSNYTYSSTASRISRQTLPDSIFALPNLPQTKYQFGSIGTEPQFKGGMDGYRHFLEKHLNGNLAAKYVEIPRGQKEAFQKVTLRFIVTDEGKVVNVRAINRKEVNSFLADDAEKVMGKVPRLVPATLFGQKIPFVYQASVTYANTR